MKDKNSKSYKQARRQKAIAFGRKASALHKKRKAEEYALLLEMRAQHPTPKGKGMRIRRRTAVRIITVAEAYEGWGAKDETVQFCLKAKDQILATPHIHSYEFEVIRG